MPYILQSDRPDLDKAIEFLVGLIPHDAPGDVNYVITRIMWLWLKKEVTRYVRLNTCMGLFTCAANEFYHRVVRPYEDKKIKENGDVYV